MYNGMVYGKHQVVSCSGYCGYLNFGKNQDTLGRFKDHDSKETFILSNGCYNEKKTVK